jgi:hypothetical protein
MGVLSRSVKTLDSDECSSTHHERSCQDRLGAIVLLPVANQRIGGWANFRSLNTESTLPVAVSKFLPCPVIQPRVVRALLGFTYPPIVCTEEGLELERRRDRTFSTEVSRDSRRVYLIFGGE